MPENKYMDLLLVWPVSDDGHRLVLCESSEAHKGDMVMFDGGKFGIVERVAWANANSGDLVVLLREAGVVSNAEIVYGKTWENELHHK